MCNLLFFWMKYVDLYYFVHSIVDKRCIFARLHVFRPEYQNVTSREKSCLFISCRASVIKPQCCIKKTEGDNLQKRPRTFSYFFFYALFLPDSWQILIGVIASYFLAPLAMSPGTGLFGRVMLYVMIATIGYAASRLPARGICRIIKRLILGERLNSQ